MIIAVGSDKGSPGATSLAVLLGIVWPDQRIVMECDPSGADLPFRMRRADSGEALWPDPSVAALAAAARLGVDVGDLARYAQSTTLGVPVVPGPLTAERATALRTMWPSIAEIASAWPGVVIADLGRLQPGNAAFAMARAAEAVVLVSRQTTDGLYHLRERASVLAGVLGGSDSGPRLWVVPAGPAVRRREAQRDVSALLESIGGPASIAGYMPLDGANLADLWAGATTRRLMRGALVSAARGIGRVLLARVSESTTSVPRGISLAGDLS